MYIIIKNLWLKHYKDEKWLGKAMIYISIFGIVASFSLLLVSDKYEHLKDEISNKSIYGIRFIQSRANVFFSRSPLVMATEETKQMFLDESWWAYITATKNINEIRSTDYVHITYRDYKGKIPIDIFVQLRDIINELDTKRLLWERIQRVLNVSLIMSQIINFLFSYKLSSLKKGI